MLRSTALALTFIVGMYSHAQQTLTWSTCVQEAAQANDEIRSSFEATRAAEFDRKAAFGAFLPSLNGTVGYNYGVGFEGDPDLAVGSTYMKWTLKQNLFAGLADGARLDIAKAGERAARAKLITTKAKVSYDLKLAYSSLLFAQRSLTLQDEIIRRRQKNQRLVELRFKSGRENRGSVLLSDAYFKQSQFDALLARNNVQIASAELAQVLGRDTEENFVLSEEIPLQPLPAEAPDYRRLVLETPDHDDYVAQVDQARGEIVVARAAFIPQLSLEAVTENNGPRWFPEREMWNVGAGLSFPIFNGGRDYYASRKAVAGYNAAGARRENVDRQLLAKLKVNYTAYVQNIEKLKVDESFREAALKRAEIARSKYNNGLMTFEDWDVIESDLISREKAVLLSQRDLARSEGSWLQAQGEGVIP